MVIIAAIIVANQKMRTHTPPVVPKWSSARNVVQIMIARPPAKPAMHPNTMDQIIRKDLTTGFTRSPVESRAANALAEHIFNDCYARRIQFQNFVDVHQYCLVGVFNLVPVDFDFFQVVADVLK